MFRIQIVRDIMKNVRSMKGLIIISLFFSVNMALYILDSYNTDLFREHQLKKSLKEVNKKVEKIRLFLQFVDKRLKFAKSTDEVVHILKDVYSPDITGFPDSQIPDVIKIVNLENPHIFGAYGNLKETQDFPKSFLKEVSSDKKFYQIREKGDYLFFILKIPDSVDLSKAGFLILKLGKESFLNFPKQTIVFDEKLNELSEILKFSKNEKKEYGFIRQVSFSSDFTFNTYIRSNKYGFYVLEYLEDYSIYIFIKKYYPYYIMILLLLFMHLLIRKTYKEKIKNELDICYKSSIGKLELTTREQKNIISNLKKEAIDHLEKIKILNNILDRKNFLELEIYRRKSLSDNKLLKKLEFLQKDMNIISTKDSSMAAILEIISEAVSDLEESSLFIDKKLSPQRIYINDIINKSIDIIKGIILAKDIKIEIDCSHEDSEISADEFLLSIIFLNLIKCSVDRLSSNGKLSISVLVLNDGTSFQFSIMDDGYSFDMKDLTVFDLKRENYINPTNLPWVTIEKLIKLYGGKILEKKESADGNTLTILFPTLYKGQTHKIKTTQKVENVLKFPTR